MDIEEIDQSSITRLLPWDEMLFYETPNTMQDPFEYSGEEKSGDNFKSSDRVVDRLWYPSPINLIKSCGPRTVGLRREVKVRTASSASTSQRDLPINRNCFPLNSSLHSPAMNDSSSISFIKSFNRELRIF